MTTFLDIYKKIAERNDLNVLFSNDDTMAKDVICHFFSAHEKLDLLENDSEKREKTFNSLSEGARLQHMVSTMLIGKWLYGITTIKNIVDSFLQDYNLRNEEEFMYIWGMITLFHDFAYKFEANKKLVDEGDKEPKYKSYEEFIEKEILPIQENIEDKSFRPACEVIDNAVGVNSLYKDAYKTMLCNNHNYCDHGVCGGLLLYNRLCQIRSTKENQMAALVNGSVENDYKIHIKNVLRWGKELIAIYNMAAWVIICHNLWPSMMKGYEKGKKYISLTENPLLFLFCLVDTIDPVKFVSKNRKDTSFECVDLLKDLGISINIDDLGTHIIIQVQNTDNTLAFEYLSHLQKEETLQDWLTDVEINTKDQITILLKSHH